MEKRETLVIKNVDGIHARPSAIIAREAQRFPADITISHNSVEADAKSVISILTLGMHQGAEVELIVGESENTEEAFDVMKELLLREYNLR